MDRTGRAGHFRVTAAPLRMQAVVVPAMLAELHGPTDAPVHTVVPRVQQA